MVALQVATDPNNTEPKELWVLLPYEEQVEISLRIANEIVPAALVELGLDGQFEMITGGFLEDTSPAIRIRSDRPTANVRLAKLLGYALTSSPWPQFPTRHSLADSRLK